MTGPMCAIPEIPVMRCCHMIPVMRCCHMAAHAGKRATCVAKPRTRPAVPNPAGRAGHVKPCHQVVAGPLTNREDPITHDLI
jgi:hypothetical protein